jgi:hypothetical protein
VSTLWELLQRFGRLFVWAVIVMPWEQALRVRAGRRQRVLNAGVHLRIPFLDSVYRQSVRLRLSNVPLQTLTTRDAKTLTIGATLAFTVVDIQRLYQTLHHAEGTLINLAATAIADYVASHDAADCLPAQLGVAVGATLALDRYGLGDGAVRITDWALIRAHRLVMDQRWATANEPGLNTRDAELTP